MANVEKRNGKYRARYTDPRGQRQSRTFLRKADAERFLREMQLAIDRGCWLDPSAGEIALTQWAEVHYEVAHLAGSSGRIDGEGDR